MTQLSFIVCGRNDDYGGRFLERVNMFITSIYILSKKYQVETEIVFVEWNPPPDKNSFINDLLKMNPDIKTSGQKIKFIQVPFYFHNQYENRKHNPVPLLDYIGKNVGIRRCSGDFIVICSPDLIFSDKIFHHLMNGFYKSGFVYRAPRIDVKPVDTIPTDEKEYESLIETCKNQIIANHGTGNTPVIDDKVQMDNPFTNACGDFLLMAKEDWYSVGGCSERTDIFCHIDSETLYNCLRFTQQWVLPADMCVYHQDHDRNHHDNFSHDNFYENHSNWGMKDVELYTISL